MALNTLPQSVGIADGRSSSSYYFVGSQADNLFYFDPHYTRATISLRPLTQMQTAERERGIQSRQATPERGSVSMSDSEEDDDMPDDKDSTHEGEGEGDGDEAEDIEGEVVVADVVVASVDRDARGRRGRRFLRRLLRLRRGRRHRPRPPLPARSLRERPKWQRRRHRG